MADNYLENKYENLIKNKTSMGTKKATAVSSLMLKNRSYRGYDQRCVVTLKHLKHIVSVNDKIPSARNQQVLRFKLVDSNNADKVLNLIKLGSALSDLHLPIKGTEPRAFIIICSIIDADKWTYTDLGISCQSMLLQAVEMGLNGICIGAFNKEKIKDEFNLEAEPLLILAIGKGAEKIRIKSIEADKDHKYYRENGEHIVPKVKIDELIL
ncbi:MAG TPA: nitroreductase family protein [Candidatus Enterocola sp.]|nr:nitroreductase family protein [Candidatus Enterocola sp.]